MLQKQLKQSISDYNRQKQLKQTEDQKTIFRWKVITLALCILSIVLIGVLSELFKLISDEEVLRFNTTFLPELLSQSQQITKVSEAKYMMQGLNLSSQVKFDSSHLVYSAQKQALAREMLKSINQKGKIMFLWNLQTLESFQQYSFGMFLKQQFDFQAQQDKGMIEITDSNQDKSSVFFSLAEPSNLRMDLHLGCNLYAYNITSGTVVIMESIEITNAGNLTVNMKKWECFGSTEQAAVARFRNLTGINVEKANQPKVMGLERLQVFALSKKV